MPPNRFTFHGIQVATLLRIITHTGALLPLLVTAGQYFTNHLSANPVQTATQRAGDTALTLLMLSLACTPLNTLFRFAPALRVRRALGMYAFLYAAIHVYLFVGVDYGFNWEFLSLDALPKPYIWVGAGAFVILLALAVTAFRRWQKRLRKGWKRLHQLVYLAGVLVVVHYFWVSKGDLLRLTGNIRQPLAYAVALALLLILRIPPVRRRCAGWWQNLRRGRK